MKLPHPLNVSHFLRSFTIDDSGAGQCLGLMTTQVDATQHVVVWLPTLGVRQVRIYLPRGLRGRIVMSYLLRVCDRSRRASICFISAFVTGASLWYGVLI